MEDITRRTIVHYHDFAEIWFDTADVLDVITTAKGTVLSIVPSAKVFPILLEPVNHRIRVFLYGCRKDD